MFCISENLNAKFPTVSFSCNDTWPVYSCYSVMVCFSVLYRVWQSWVFSSMWKCLKYKRVLLWQKIYILINGKPKIANLMLVFLYLRVCSFVELHSNKVSAVFSCEPFLEDKYRSCLKNKSSIGKLISSLAFPFTRLTKKTFRYEIHVHMGNKRQA